MERINYAAEETAIIALVNTVGRENTDIITLLESAGFHRKEEFGTLVFTAPLSVLGRITRGLIVALEQFQLEHRLFILIEEDALNEALSNKERLEALKWWEPLENPETLVVYDLRLTDRQIGAGLRYMLDVAGGLRVFDSCHAIIRSDETHLANMQIQLDNLVAQSNQDPCINARTGQPIQYHGGIFSGHHLGTPRVLEDWAEYKVKMLIERFQRLQDQLKGRMTQIQQLPAEFEGWLDLDDAQQTVKGTLSLVNQMVRKGLPDLLDLVDHYREMGLTDIIVTNTYTPAKSLRDKLSTMESTFTGTITDITQDTETLLDTVRDLALDKKAELEQKKQDDDADPAPAPAHTRKLRTLTSFLKESA